MKPPAGQYETTGWMGGAGGTTHQQVVSKPLVNRCLLQPLVSRWFQNHSSTSAYRNGACRNVLVNCTGHTLSVGCGHRLAAMRPPADLEHFFLVLLRRAHEQTVI